MKAVIYARQSSGKEDVSESVEAQIKNCLQLATQKKMEIIGVYRDLNSSGELYPEGAEQIAQLDYAYQQWIQGQQNGRKNSRHGLGELIKKLPEADVLLVNEMTRLYRPVNHSYLENYIHNLLRINKITIIQYQGGEVDLSKFDQQLVLALKNRILYEDLRKKRENSINAFRIKRDSGKLCCGSRNFAVVYHGNDKISIDSEKADVVKQIYSGILSGAPLNSIIRACNAKAGCLMMYPSLFYSIARQPLYAGFQYNSEGSLIRNSQITGQELIAMEDWLAVQKILAKKKRVRNTKTSHWLPLSGRLICGVCQRKLVCRIDHGKVYYTCNSQKFDPASHNCFVSRIRFESGAYEKNALYDAILPLLVIGIMEKIKKIDISDESYFMENLVDEITDLFLTGYLTKKEMGDIMLKIKEKQISENLYFLKKLYSCYVKQIVEQKISEKMYEDFLQLSDFKAVVHQNHIGIQTCMGNFSLPRLRKNNRVWFPQWSIRFRKTTNNNELPRLIICYFSGKKSVLADFGTLKIITK